MAEMNEEYLWNKTGNDPEIEALEATLSSVSLRTAPKFPATSAQKRFSFLRLAWAIPALALIVIGIFFFQNGKTSNTENSVAIAEPVVEPVAPIAPESDKVVSFETATPKPQTAKFIAAKKPVPADLRSSALSRPAIPKRSVKKKEKISPEEQFAYDQLMRALSITSENLANVREKSGERTLTLR